jgi:hypothetical protein
MGYSYICKNEFYQLSRGKNLQNRKKPAKKSGKGGFGGFWLRTLESERETALFHSQDGALDAP